MRLLNAELAGRRDPRLLAHVNQEAMLGTVWYLTSSCSRRQALQNMRAQLKD